MPTPTTIDQGEKNFRPESLKDFIGQGAAKATLAIMIESAQIRSTPVDHINLTGGPGLGKTTIAAIIAAEMGSSLRELSAPSIERLGDLVSVLIALQDRDVLFLDEIHRLRHEVAETLYSAMEDFKISIPVKGGTSEGAAPITMTLKQFTLVGATTDYGLMPEPLRARFGHVFTLDLYTVMELEQIVHRAADLSEVVITLDAARMLAERSRGTPRTALRLFRRCRDVATVAGDPYFIDEGLAARTMQDYLDLDHLGLGKDDRLYLRTLAGAYNGGPVGPKALAASTGFDEARVVEDIEPWLLRSGLLARTRLGRKLTRAGWEHVRLFADLPALPVEAERPEIEALDEPETIG